jgi:hypothetical protein
MAKSAGGGPSIHILYVHGIDQLGGESFVIWISLAIAKTPSMFHQEVGALLATASCRLKFSANLRFSLMPKQTHLAC